MKSESSPGCFDSSLLEQSGRLDKLKKALVPSILAFISCQIPILDIRPAGGAFVPSHKKL